MALMRLRIYSKCMNSFVLNVGMQVDSLIRNYLVAYFSTMYNQFLLYKIKNCLQILYQKKSFRYKDECGILFDATSPVSAAGVLISC